MDPATTVVLVVIVAMTVAVSWAWHRALRASGGWRERALTAETTGREQRVQAQEERRVRDLILSTMHEGVLLIGRDLSVAFANDAIGRHLPSIPASLDAVLPLALRTAIQDCRERGEPTSVLVETGVPARWLRGTITPAADEATLVVVRDVTQQRQLENVRRDFVANASHELKTPAATIQAVAETLGQAAADDPAAIPHFVSQLEREAVRLSRIVADLLDLSRLESGSALDDLVSLGAAAREEGQRLEETAIRSGVTLEILTEGERPVRGSQRDLALLARNLIDNAIRYSHEGGQVVVQVDSDGEEATLRVSDTGIGIPSRDIHRIFERFYRVDRARSRETGGTGLGLAIVKHVVENHGGTIEVESELGRGTTFRVKLPAASRP
ncbi:MAG: ATP-binding protein [Actinomycetota bacterium]|nr:ATP-binding protein [Actinomycetota bacterium]